LIELILNFRVFYHVFLNLNNWISIISNFVV
jgi:hypothetical protein